MGTAQNGRSADSVPAMQITAMERSEERRCLYCAGGFIARQHNQQYCTSACQLSAKHIREYGTAPFGGLSTAVRGTLSELAVTCDLLEKGWQVFRAVAPACFADIAAYKNDASHFLEVRTGHRMRTTGKVAFSRRINGMGVTGYAVYEPHEKSVIYLDLNGDPMPLSDLWGQRRSALLTEEPDRRPRKGQGGLL